MEIRHCLQLLELEHNPTLEEVRRAYRDLVRVWHPDRFAGDPRLKRRAEERVKQLNSAYETLVAHLERSRHGQAGEAVAEDVFGKAGLSPTEAFFETGTRKVLIFWHSISRAARSAVKEAAGKGEDQAQLKRR